MLSPRPGLQVATRRSCCASWLSASASSEVTAGDLHLRFRPLQPEHGEPLPEPECQADACIELDIPDFIRDHRRKANEEPEQ